MEDTNEQEFIREYNQVYGKIVNMISKSLLLFRISSIQNLFYHMAWNAYEIVAKRPEEYAFFRSVWEKAFRICESIAEFMYDFSTKTFLSKRKSKYLV